MGMLCVNQKFRSDFYNSPTSTAQIVVGPLTSDEMEQLERLAGNRAIPGGKTRTEFVEQVKSACETVFMSIDCTCPSPPCPCPDNNDLY